MSPDTVVPRVPRSVGREPLKVAESVLSSVRFVRTFVCKKKPRDQFRGGVRR